MKERCWLLLDDGVIEVSNKSENGFSFDPEEFHDVLTNHKVLGIIHTHEKNCAPSIHDIEGMMWWNFPWIIMAPTCIKGYILDLGVKEININPFFLEMLKDLFMKLSD
ncbi:hypothetical protein HS7_05840 [Sulfolobales archaeon HS-7]|nr:hypothetical protein HS7_05840 [Sulfolobales archaeon HS-7]